MELIFQFNLIQQNVNKFKIFNGLNGIAKIPGDKSISHRSIIIPSIANGITEIKNILKSEDVLKNNQCYKI